MTRRKPAPHTLRPVGFTLVEIMIALGIFAILAAAVAPALMGFLRGREADSTMNRIVQTLTHAQQRAIFSRQPASFVIDIDKGSYWVVERKDESRDEHKRRKRKRRFSDRDERDMYREGMLRTHAAKLPDGYQIGSVYFYRQGRSALEDQVAIHFFPDGTATGAAILLQRLPTKKYPLREMAIEIHHTTGRAQEMLREARLDLFGGTP